MREIFELLLARCAKALSACPAWRTQTCCATSCIPACGSNTTAKMQKRTGPAILERLDFSDDPVDYRVLCGIAAAQK